MEFSIYRGVAVVLAATQVGLGHELCHVVIFLAGQGMSDYEYLVKDFDIIADVIIFVVPPEDIVCEVL